MLEPTKKQLDGKEALCCEYGIAFTFRCIQCQKCMYRESCAKLSNQD